MLIIRAEQLNVFERCAARRFEDEMVAHAKDFAPRFPEFIGDDQLRVAIGYAIKQAQGYAFSYRGPIRLYIEMMFLCGSGFDTDPQYSPLGAILRASSDQMQRAEQIYEASLHYLENVHGPDDAKERKALTALLLMLATKRVIPSSDFEDSMADELSGIFPQKVAYIGEARLAALITEGTKQAARYAFTTDWQKALLGMLMFAFGHGCTDDPLYPWIARTLKDETTTDSAVRTARLEKQVVTWLEHVLARRAPGARM